MSYYFPSWQYANWCFPSQSLKSTTKCYGQFKNVYRPLTSPRFWHNRNFKKCVCITKNGEDTRKKKNKNEITDITVSDLNRSTKEYFYMSKMGGFLVFCFVFPFIQIGYMFEKSPIEVSRWNSEIITELSQC